MTRSFSLTATLCAALACAPAVGASDDWVDLLAPGDLRLFRDPAGEWRTAGAITTSSDDPGRLTGSAGTGAIVNGDAGRTSDLLTVEEW